jgi:predicted GIY-YIG superfamily endonuclease
LVTLPISNEEWKNMKREIKSTACRRPFKVVLVEYYYSKKDAMRRELYFKTSAGRRILRLMLSESLSEINDELRTH